LRIVIAPAKIVVPRIIVVDIAIQHFVVDVVVDIIVPAIVLRAPAVVPAKVVPAIHPIIVHLHVLYVTFLWT